MRFSLPALLATVAGAILAAAASAGSLHVTSFPSGAEVWVNATFTGKLTPMSVALAEGDHEVTVQMPDSGWNPDTRTVTITAGKNDLSVTLLPILTEGPPGPPGDSGPPGPPGPPGPSNLPPLGLFVDCAQGESLNEAYWGARDYLGALHITISGVCEESIQLDRDHVTLSGATPQDGLLSTQGDDGVISIDRARGIALNNLTVVGGYRGVSVTRGGSFLSTGMTVTGSTQAGIDVHLGSSGYLYDCTVTGNPKYGVSASGGVVEIHGCQLDQNWYGVNTVDGGNVLVQSSFITNSTQHGLWAQMNGTARLWGTSIEGSAHSGVVVLQNSTVVLTAGSRVADSGGDGVQAAADSYLNLEGSVIENSLGAGVLLEQNSTLSLFDDVVIRNNQGDGIVLDGLSAGNGGYAEISGNGGWGILCAGPPAIAAVQNYFNMGDIVFYGNAYGPTNCP